MHVYVAEWYALGNLIEEAPHLRSIVRAVQERGHPACRVLRQLCEGDRGSEERYRSLHRDGRQRGEARSGTSSLKAQCEERIRDPENLLIQEIIKNHVILKGVE